MYGVLNVDKLKNTHQCHYKKINIKYHLAMYQLQIYILLIKTKANNNQSKQNENKNNYLHNYIIKAQQIKLLL